MKILFTASVLQRDELLTYYDRIINFLKKAEHEVNSAHIFDISLEEIYKQSRDESTDYLNSFQKWITENDLIITETSFPSTLNIGYQIFMALQRNKPVIALYKKGRMSNFFSAVNSDKLVYEEYTDENLESVLKDCLDFIDTKSDARFNFYLPSKAVAYIDKESKEKRLSRSAVLRQIIAEKMDPH